MGQKQREVADSAEALSEERHFVFQPTDEKQSGSPAVVEITAEPEIAIRPEVAIRPEIAVKPDVAATAAVGSKTEIAPLSLPTPPEPQKPSFRFGMTDPESLPEPALETTIADEPQAAPTTTRRAGGADRLLASEVTYFHQMLTQFQTFDASDHASPSSLHDNPYAISAIQSLAAKSDAQMTWEDLDRMEISLLRVMPESRLRSQAWSLRARYFESSGPTLNALYLASRPPDWNDATVPTDILRADLESLVSETQRNRVMPPEIDFTHEFLSEAAGKWAASLCIAGFIGFVTVRVVLAPSDAATILPIATAFLSGGVGGFVSLQSRVSRTARLNLQQQDQVLSVLEPPPLFLYPVQGAVLAAFFYFLLVSGYLHGTIFPSGRIAELVTPLGGAHLVIWCFVIGLLVRFLPDIPRWFSRRLSKRKEMSWKH